MPNEPQHAKEKRTEPEQRRNAQGDHEGSAHTPQEFDTMNPEQQGLGDQAAKSTSRSGQYANSKRTQA